MCIRDRLERDVAHLILPDEVQNEPVAADVPASDPAGRLTPLEIAPPRASLEQALELLRGARRPVLIVGHGARFAMGPITALAESLHAPVLTTFKAKGQISDHHPLGCGVLGRSGTPIASWFMNEADLLLVLGASFSNHTGIYPGKPTIQVDLDPLALGKFHGVTVPVWGEISVVVDALREGVSDGLQTEDQRPQVAERWAISREEKRRRAADDPPGARRCGDLGRCRQQHLFVRALLRMPGPVGADVGLSGIDRLCLPRRGRGLGGGGPGAADRVGLR